MMPGRPIPFGALPRQADYFVCLFTDGGQPETVRLFGERVIPVFRMEVEGPEMAPTPPNVRSTREPGCSSTHASLIGGSQ